MELRTVIFIVLLAIIAGFFIEGYIVGLEVKKNNATCDIGLGKHFCWKWHKVYIGEYDASNPNFLEEG